MKTLGLLQMKNNRLPKFVSLATHFGPNEGGYLKMLEIHSEEKI